MGNTTQGQYLSLQHAYNWFNRSLFGNELPPVLITLQRSKVAYGYYWAQQYTDRQTGEERLDEIALNPEAMHGRTDEEILSTLVHEMVHCWQQHFGEPSRKGYHNQQWADAMMHIGLVPSDTGKIGGKKVGQKMSHYIDPNGDFALVCRQWLKRNPKGVQWEATTGAAAGGGDAGGDGEGGGDAEKAKKRASKTKYTCPECGQNAWAKPGAILICGVCYAHSEDDTVLVWMIEKQ